MSAFRFSPRVEINPKGAISRDHAALSFIGSASAYCLELLIQGLPRTANGSHGHWRAKYAATKAWKQKVFALAWPHKPSAPLRLAKLTCTRFSSNQPDYDNLVISFKACVDGLKQAGVIVDDKDVHLLREYRWEKAAPRAGRITIKIEQLTTNKE